jgi:hypothetical protein
MESLVFYLLISLIFGVISMESPKIRRFVSLRPRSSLWPTEVLNTGVKNQDISSIFPKSDGSVKESYVEGLRVLQFNILADGLSGLRDDLGDFSRVSAEDLAWQRRSKKILGEILQYDPDVVTLQECDHFYDFFLHELASRGYEGHFAPKPASSCLQVSPNSDGCAIFVRRKKLRVVSRETVTFTLSKAEVESDSTDTTKRAQNQVGLMALCEFLPRDDYRSGAETMPYIILATTHLKAAKSANGENYRVSEVEQLLASIYRLQQHIKVDTGVRTYLPAVVVTGDFNAAPCVNGTLVDTVVSRDASAFARKSKSDAGKPAYEPLAYRAVKAHRLGLRSVYNDDIEEFASSQLDRHCHLRKGIYTTWKARRRRSDVEERVVKGCIDYVFYARGGVGSNESGGSGSGSGSGNGNGNGNEGPGEEDCVTPVVATSALDVYSEAEIGDKLMPSEQYPSDHLAICCDLQVSWEYTVLDDDKPTT